MKTRLVDPAENFLLELGITTADGRVRSAKRNKYHQIEEFIRVLDAGVREAMAAGRLDRRPLRVVDLGCGNAYLTFAAYRHLTHALGIDVELIGVDLKQQAREHNETVASRLGWQTQVSFVEGSIGSVDIGLPVDIALTLHACDTATDDALARAVQWEAPLVLAAPCCHQDIQRQLRAGEPAHPYGLITRHGLLRERFGDIVTDAMRVHLMRTAGYRTDIIEFVDTQHTPRNVLLRAHRTGVPPSAQQVTEYQALVDAWHLHPRLDSLLRHEVRGGRELPGEDNS